MLSGLPGSIHWADVTLNVWIRLPRYSGISNIINITLKDDKVHFKYGLNGEYYAINDTIEYTESNYTCKKEIEVTKYGERINYTCNYEEEE